jgi:hypothetical protein
MIYQLKIISIVAASSCFLATSPRSGQSPRVERAMVQRVKRMPASELQSNLPSEHFDHWLRRIVGRDAVTTWEVNDCGEQSGAKAGKDRDFPICVQAETRFHDGSLLVLMVAVGTAKKGMQGKPSLKDAFIERNGKQTTLRDLSQLAESLR